MQCLASKPSSPAAGFGSSNRDAYVKVLICKHAAEQRCISLNTQLQTASSAAAAADGRGPPLHKLHSMCPVMTPRAQSRALRRIRSRLPALPEQAPHMSEWHPKSVLHEMSTLC